MAGAGNIGRLWVNVDVDMKKFDAAMDRVQGRLKQTAQAAGGSTGALGETMSKAGAGAETAARGFDRTGAAAKRAMRPTTALNYSMLRLSQAFINLRYGNPIGVIAGLGQAGAAAGRGISGLVQNMKGLKIASAGAVGAMAGLPVIIGAIAAATSLIPAAAAGALAKVGLEAAADLEMLKIQYEGMLGSAEKAQQEVDYLMALGAESVVPTETILEANRQLLAFGITADGLRQNLVKFMSDYGSAAGLSTSQVQGLGYVIGQIQAQGKALTQDIRQLANASIGMDKLAAAIGVSTAEFQEMVKEGKATADVILPAILKIGEGAEDAAEKARNSARGILNNLKDIAKVNMAQAFEDLLEQIKPVLKWVEQFISAFDFTWIAKSFEQVAVYFREVFGGMAADSAETGEKVAEVIGHIVNVVGFAIAKQIEYWKALWETIKVIWYAVSSLVQAVLGTMVDQIAKVVGWAASAGEAMGFGWGDTLRQMQQGMDGWATNTMTAAAAAGNAMIDSANAAGTAWSSFFDFSSFKLVKKDWQGSGVSAIDPAAFTGVDPIGGVDDGGKKGGKGKDDPRFKKWIEWLNALQKLIEQFNTARKDLLALQQGAFGTEGALSKAMSFGDSSTNFQADVDSIIGGFDKASDAITRYYDAIGGGEDEIFGRKVAKKARQDRNKTIKQLESQTQALVDLARENKRIQDELEAYRESEVNRLGRQLAKTEELYQGFIGADGKYLKGRIEIANDVLDKATQAYEDANDKLQEMLDERDDFLNGIRDSARSFVNALSVNSEMVQEFRRLDDVGSFAMQEKQKTASLKEQMRDRLEALKEWAANLSILRSKGLDSDLMRDLISAGPEGSADAVKELANAGQDSIDEINSIQSELASVTGSVQDQANSMFFASAIGAQQNLVNSLNAQRAAAEAAAVETEAEYNRIRMQLEATQAAVEAGTDAHSRELMSQMEANAKAAGQVTDDITSSLKWLTDKQNPFNTRALGKNALKGLIKGLEDKEPELISKAKAIADAVSKTIARALRINSPSKLMYKYGEWVGEGLALGMDSSIDKIDAAAFRMSRNTIPNLDSETGGPATPVVKVYIGDTELRDIVDVQISDADEKSLDFVSSGRRY